jgi:hypothetical protein
VEVNTGGPACDRTLGDGAGEGGGEEVETGTGSLSGGTEDAIEVAGDEMDEAKKLGLALVEENDEAEESRRACQSSALVESVGIEVCTLGAGRAVR